MTHEHLKNQETATATTIDINMHICICICVFKYFCPKNFKEKQTSLLNGRIRGTASGKITKISCTAATKKVEGQQKQMTVYRLYSRQFEQILICKSPIRTN